MRKTFIQTIISILVCVFLVSLTVYSATTLQVFQGGTGATSFTAGECLVGNGTNAITTTACGAGGSGDVTDVGDCATGACLDGTSDGGTYIKFYDAQGAGQLITGNLTGVQTWTMPDSTGTVALTTTFTAGDALTLTGTDFDFDGGATPAGDLGGTWALPSVDDDSHAHTTTTISGLDISADTNLTAGDALTLTDDDIDFDGGATPGGELGGTWASPTVDSGIHDDEYIQLTDNFVGDVTGTYGATDITQTVLGVGGTDTIFPADPNADRYLMWDDDPGALAWAAAAGESTTVSDTTTMNLTLTGADITADGLYTAGDHLTLTLADFDVDDDFLLNTGDIGTGVYDFGGATSVEIPNGAPTVDTTGEIGIDTTSDQFAYMGASKRILTYQNEICGALEDPVDADDNIAFFFPRQAITITDVYCQVDGGTSVAMTISDGTNALEAITCDDDGAEDDGSIANGTFTSLERMEIDLASSSGTNTWLNWCVTYTITSD